MSADSANVRPETLAALSTAARGLSADAASIVAKCAMPRGAESDLRRSHRIASLLWFAGMCVCYSAAGSALLVVRSAQVSAAQPAEGLWRTTLSATGLSGSRGKWERAKRGAGVSGGEG